MVIKDVKKVDEGDYTCIAKNKAGEKAEEVSLNVFGKRITPSAYDSIKNAVAPLFFFFFFLPLPGLFLLYLLTFAVYSLFQWLDAVLHSVKHMV